MAQDLQRGREIWNRLTEVLAFLKGVSPQSLGALEGADAPASAAPVPSGEVKARRAPAPRAQQPAPRAQKPSQAQPRAQKPAPRAAPASQVIQPSATAARGRQEGSAGKGSRAQQPSAAPRSAPRAATPQGGAKPRISAGARARARQQADSADEEDTAPLPAPPRVEVNLPELQLGSQSVDEISGVTLKLPAVKGPNSDT
jgi:hypothetical protein